MAQITDAERKAAYLDAAKNGVSAKGYVEFDLTETALRWVRNELEITLAELRERICEHVIDGGIIDEVRETRPQWSEYEYHHDLRFVIGGKRVYVETRLFARYPFIPDQPSISVVNVHAP